MLTPRRGFLFASALLTLAACPTPSAPADAGTAAKPNAKIEAEVSAPARTTAEQPADAESEANDGFSDAEPAPTDEPGPLPAWLSPDAFEHVKIVRQDERANKLPTGESATMLVLELPAGTTPEQCLAAAKAKLGESIPTLAEPSTTPQGYLTIKGAAGEYEYTVVCGVAKAVPTMFLSVVQ